MNGKSREDLVFELYYSYNLENLHYHFNARINNLLTVIQLLLSSAIIGDLGRYFPNINITIGIGVILALLSTLSLVYRFGEKSVASRIATNRYSAVIHRYTSMTNDELAEILFEYSSTDNAISGALSRIAYKRSTIQLSGKDDTQLTCYQSFIAKFCGEYF
ncbi:hypothetical protein KZ326_03925 [Glaesserella parasuis]|nr:hypothetical protein [Glaesserella parasuis]